MGKTGKKEKEKSVSPEGTFRVSGTDCRGLVAAAFRGLGLVPGACNIHETSAANVHRGKEKST